MARPPKIDPRIDPAQVAAFVERWKGNTAGEMKVAQQHYIELCAALGLPGPDPAAPVGTYGFEQPVSVARERGKAPATERMDVYRQGHFVWENKQGTLRGERRQGHGRRDSGAWDTAMNEAFAQARSYASHVVGRPPPFVVVCDVGHHFEVWSDFSGTGREYDQRPSRRIRIGELVDLEQATFLRRVIDEPLLLDPARYQQQVSVEVAAELAGISAALEESGEPASVVARFLMRCLFAMFAEDTDLLPDKSFTSLLEAFVHNPSALASQLEHLFGLMDAGGFAFGLGRVPRFNGGLFAGSCAVRLSPRAASALLSAARRDWSEVEPSIFGTLVEQALNPDERHSLGAHFTPRAFIERLVRPTVIEPLRDDWLKVRAEAWRLVGDKEPGKVALRKAIELVQGFHARLCQVRVLDPACGTGNFLYVTYDLLKDLEVEVLRALSDLGERQEGITGLSGATVSPAQLLGIERNPRAREIADLVLWIGHLQRTRRDRGSAAIGEPVLRALDNIEGRDAVLVWEGAPVPRRDASGAVVTVWDTKTKKRDPVTGKDVPDEGARVAILDYPGARQADWPSADFIVGNPPFIGDKEMKESLGEGYVDALRKAWPAVPGSADLVMYWWHKAANLTIAGEVRGFGFITTNSISQTFNRSVVAAALDSGLCIKFAISDHYWIRERDNAAVRIAMTSCDMAAQIGERWAVDERGNEVSKEYGKINAQLRMGANIDQARALLANSLVCCPGVKLYGQGFLLDHLEASQLLSEHKGASHPVIRPYLTGGEIVRQNQYRYVIDFLGFSQAAAASGFPRLFQRVLDLVKPERDQNRRPAYRNNWWIFGEPRRIFRRSLCGLARYIGTPETSKHRVFTFIDGEVLCEGSVVVIALDGSDCLGVLSSRIHVIWSLAAGGRLGVGNDPRYNKSRCFDPFPFPDLTDRPELSRVIGQIAEQLEAHRNDIARIGSGSTLTAQYNALSRLREARAGGPALTPAEQKTHSRLLTSILANLHDQLDAAVAEAYGWPVDLPEAELLHRLVALNAARAAEEAAGHIRYLRPEFQAPQAAAAVAPEEEPQAEEIVALPPLPTDPLNLLIALRDALTAAGQPLRPEALAARFADTRASQLTEHLQLLRQLGALVERDGAWTPR